MMTRAATVNPVSMRNLASITLSIIALSTATLGISRYGDGSRPVADFLSRAQSEAEARGFEELLGTLGEKPAATQKATPVAHADEPQVAAKPVTASTQSSTPAPQGIASPPKPAVKPPVAIVQTSSIAKKSDVRKVQTAARRSADEWMRKGSSLLRLVGVRL
jgi:hypothetical protein